MLFFFCLCTWTCLHTCSCVCMNVRQHGARAVSCQFTATLKATKTQGIRCCSSVHTQTHTYTTTHTRVHMHTHTRLHTLLTHTHVADPAGFIKGFSHDTRSKMSYELLIWKLILKFNYVPLMRRHCDRWLRTCREKTKNSVLESLVCGLSDLVCSR